MLKRIIAALLACLLLAGVLPALAETNDIVIQNDSPLILDEGLPLADIGELSGGLSGELSGGLSIELSQEGPDAGLPAADTSANAAQTVTLSISKSCTKDVRLGFNYQITISGKKIKACKSSDKTVATVTQLGLVRTKHAGTVKITVTPSKGKKLVLTLNVTDPKADKVHYMISHAMGGVDGYSYTNCLEGFQENYAEGHRVFEVDLEYTSDDELVVWHHWNRQVCSEHRKGKAPTYRQFMNYRIFDRFTPLDLEALLRLMNEYPDVRIVVDGKYPKSSTVKREYRTIVKTAKKLGIPEVLDRMVVELYNKDMFDVVDGVHHFKAYMLTLYKLFDEAPKSSKLESLAKFCKRKGIATIAMYADWWKPKYFDIIDPLGLDIALYTVNSANDAERFFDQGVTALFTDFLPPVA